MLNVVALAQRIARCSTPAEVFALAIELLGNQSRAAPMIGLSQSQISRRLKDGKGCPHDLVLKVEGLTGISRHDLRPDLYPRDEPAIEAHNEFQASAA